MLFTRAGSELVSLSSASLAPVQTDPARCYRRSGMAPSTLAMHPFTHLSSLFAVPIVYRKTIIKQKQYYSIPGSLSFCHSVLPNRLRGPFSALPRHKGKRNTAVLTLFDPMIRGCFFFFFFVFFFFVFCFFYPFLLRSFLFFFLPFSDDVSRIGTYCQHCRPAFHRG